MWTKVKLTGPDYLPVRMPASHFICHASHTFYSLVDLPMERMICLSFLRTSRDGPGFWNCDLLFWKPLNSPSGSLVAVHTKSQGCTFIYFRRCRFRCCIRARRWSAWCVARRIAAWPSHRATITSCARHAQSRPRTAPTATCTSVNAPTSCYRCSIPIG